MSIAVHAVTLDLFVSMLTNLRSMLAKAGAFATERKLDAGVLEQSRLAPDMFALTRQVQLACDFAKNSAARLAGIDPPRFDDTEKTLAELESRVERTLAWLATIRPEQLVGAESRQIVVPLRNRTLDMQGLPFIQKWVLPNFYFHVTTAYALLRHNGVALGKQDFLGGV